MSEQEATPIDDFKKGQESKSYELYPQYQDSGEEWLGSIPKSWDTTKLKFLIRENLTYGINESPEKYHPEKLRYIRITDINDRGGLNEDVKKSIGTEISEDYFLQEDDILLARSGSVGKSLIFNGVEEENAVFAGYLIRVRLKDLVKPLFFKYFCQTTNYWDWIDSYSIESTIKNVSAEKYKELVVPIPPKDEQKAIVDFLERETQEIDELIEEKENLIELVEEKREAVINDQVTAGHNTISGKKGAKIDAFSNLPDDWQATSLKNTVNKFVDYRGATPKKSDSGITLITAKNIDNGKLDLSENHEYISKEEYDGWMTRGKPEVGDVLITTEAPMGEVAQIQETPVALAQRIILLKVNTELLKKDFLKYYLSSNFNQAQLMINQTGSTAKGIKASKLKGIRVLIPPINEQEEIIKSINEETKKIDKLIAHVENGIARLKEYRTALITETVTGQIDVRGEV